MEVQITQVKLKTIWEVKKVKCSGVKMATINISGLIPCLCPANERRRYKVTSSPIGWAQT